jgi:hypothetical protein
MRRGVAKSERAHTGQSNAIHSPDEWASTVIDGTACVAWSIAVVCTVAVPIPRNPDELRTKVC